MVFSDGNTKEKLLTTIPLLEVETYFIALTLGSWKRMFPFIDLCHWSQMVLQLWLVKTLAQLQFARKTPLSQTYLSYRYVNHSASCKYSKKLWEELIAYFPWYNMDCIEKRCIQLFFYCCTCIHCTVIFLPCCCLATVVGYKYRHTDWWERFMKYANEMGSGAIINIPSFVKTGSAIQKLGGGIYGQHGVIPSK
jgi:hypothetical protein